MFTWKNAIGSLIVISAVATPGVARAQSWITNRDDVKARIAESDFWKVAYLTGES